MAMNYKRLGIFGIGLALGFWLVILGLRRFAFQISGSPVASAAELVLLLAGGLLFWWWAARRLDRSDQALRFQASRLESLHRAGLAITTERDLQAVLQTVVDQSRRLIGARYGALGVLNEAGVEIESFIVSGIPPETEKRLRPHPPVGHGILGIPIQQRRSVRVDDIAAHPASVGFPPHHPPMHTFLGVPITSKGRVFGHLYLTDKVDPQRYARPPLASSRQQDGQGAMGSDEIHTTENAVPFNSDDQQLLEMFATQAAIAIENAYLYRQNREIAVLRERERFGMDLHDGIIQSIYAVGLMVDDAHHHLQQHLQQSNHAQNPEATRPVDTRLDTAGARLRDATQGLNQVITDIRRYIHDLRANSEDVDPQSNPVAEYEKLAHGLRLDGGLHVRLEIEAPLLRQLTPRQNAELLQIVREATTNIRRHAHAARVHIQLRRDHDHAELLVRDDGKGFERPTITAGGGHGLPNMRHRADSLGGQFQLESEPDAGTTLHIRFPILASPPPQSF